MEEYPNGDWRKYKMARLNKKRFCIECKSEINNSDRKLQKRTKFCSEDCADDYKWNRKVGLKIQHTKR